MPALGRSPTGTKEKRAIRRTKALELRASGLSIRDIADKLNTGRTTIAKDIKTGLAELAAHEHEHADELRTLQHKRLEKVIAESFNIIETTDDYNTKLKALEQVRRTVETIARLFGLNVEQATVSVDQRSVTFIIETDNTPPNHKANGTGNSQSQSVAETGDVPAIDGA